MSDGTIRDEMATFRSIMNFAAGKSYIRDSQVFEGKLPLSKTRREEFTPQEYRKLHSFAISLRSAIAQPGSPIVCITQVSPHLVVFWVDGGGSLVDLRGLRVPLALKIGGRQV